VVPSVRKNRTLVWGLPALRIFLPRDKKKVAVLGGAALDAVSMWWKTTVAGLFYVLARPCMGSTSTESCDASIDILVIHGGNATRKSLMDAQFNAWTDDVNFQYDEELTPSEVASSEQRERVLNYCENPTPMLKEQPNRIQILVGLKHKRAWERVASGDLPSPLLIVEDDVRLDEALPTRLREYLAELPPDFDVAWLCRIHSGLAESSISPEQPHVFPSARSEGGVAYVVTQKAARHILGKLPMKGILCMPQDLFLNGLLPAMRNFVLEPNLATHADADHSTIWDASDSSRPSAWTGGGSPAGGGREGPGKALVRRGLALEAAKNDAEAAKLYAEAAAPPYRNAQAQVNLGVLWHQGRGGYRKDAREAARLWLGAANQGYAQAMVSKAIIIIIIIIILPSALGALNISQTGCNVRELTLLSSLSPSCSNKSATSRTCFSWAMASARATPRQRGSSRLLLRWRSNHPERRSSNLASSMSTASVFPRLTPKGRSASTPRLYAPVTSTHRACSKHCRIKWLVEVF
jgi:hypothetical protein